MKTAKFNSFMAADEYLRMLGFRQTGGDPCADVYDYDLDGIGATISRDWLGWIAEFSEEMILA